MKIGRNHYGAALAAVLATGAVVAGCGSSDDDSTTNALSQSEFVAKATAICQPANEQIEDAAQKIIGSGPPTPQSFERFATAAVIPETQGVIDKFRELTPPSSQSQAYASLLTELQSVNDELKADPSRLAQQGNPFEKANQLARQAGLNACAAD
jgi:hypothetical protein